MNATNKSAIVAGATGASGRELVRLLVDDPSFSRVVALSRRNIPPAEWPRTFPGLDTAAAVRKLTVSSVDWEAATVQQEQGAAAAATSNASAPFTAADFAGHGFAANCMGTTRKDAGSADMFRRVDHDYAVTFMQLVKQHSGAANVNYAQVSSAGASSGSWFLYMATKGKTDEDALGMGFGTTTILLPGFLARPKEKSRGFVESALGFCMGGMPVENVAAAIVSVWCGHYVPGPKLANYLRNKQINEATKVYLEHMPPKRAARVAEEAPPGKL
jgi:oxidoreductase